MIRLIAISPIDAAAFYESDGKTFHTSIPFTPSVTEEVENAQEYAEMTMGYLDGQDRTFPDFSALKKFICEMQIFEIKTNPALKANRELLLELEESMAKGKSSTKHEPALARPIVKQLDSKMESSSLEGKSKVKQPTKRPKKT